jgi:hypothetical protein
MGALLGCALRHHPIATKLDLLGCRLNVRGLVVTLPMQRKELELQRKKLVRTTREHAGAKRRARVKTPIRKGVVEIHSSLFVVLTVEAPP